MNKKLIYLLVVALIMAVSAAPVFARGHHGRRASSNYAPAVSYSVCGIADCTLTGLHAHNGVNYYAHYYGDGHDYHGYCNVANCTVAGYHCHDGVYNFGQTAYYNNYGCCR